MRLLSVHGEGKPPASPDDMRERFCTCEVPLTVPIILLSRCGLAHAISHNQFSSNSMFAAVLRSIGATMRNRAGAVHIVVRFKL
jgi:hypothetical protein